jgi:hypothetical protein
MKRERNPKRGSETRQRSKTVTVRLTPPEFDALAARAAASGLKPPGYIRAAAAGAAGPRARREIPASVNELRQLLGAVGKLGANVNQLAAAANRGEVPAERELSSAALAVRDMRAAIMASLGRSP